VHRRSGREVAAKLLQTKPHDNGCEVDAISDLPDELALYLRLSHPNICRLLEAFVERDGEVWLCMEHCSGGELFDQVSKTSDNRYDTEERVADLIRQMASALCYIHGMGIVHRDNKLENWVFASPVQERIKLIDFGLAARFVQEASPSDRARRRRRPPHLGSLTKVCGTCYYVAPEVLRASGDKLTAGDGYRAEVDIWALGVILYMLISGTPPFAGRNEASILWEIAMPKNGSNHLYEAFCGRRWRNVSEQCKNLISGCLVRDPQLRLSARQVLEHPWLGQGQKTVQGRARSKSMATPRAKLLGHLVTAGYRMARCRFLAHVCGHLAQRMYLEPMLWTALKEDFCSLAMASHGAEGCDERGRLYSESIEVEELLALFRQEQGEEQGEAEAAEREAFCRAAAEALDLTGDGKLHFFEFFGAMILAGRIKVEEHYGRDAFAAFDLDCDGEVSVEDLERSLGLGQEELFVPSDLRLDMLHSFPYAGLHKTSMDTEAAVLEPPVRSSMRVLSLLQQAVHRDAEYIARSMPKRTMSVPYLDAHRRTNSGEICKQRAQQERVLDREKLRLEWKVERRSAFGGGRPNDANGLPTALPDLNRGYYTADPPPSHVFAMPRPGKPRAGSSDADDGTPSTTTASTECAETPNIRTSGSSSSRTETDLAQTPHRD